MEKNNKELSRKKFLFWGLGISTVFVLPAFLRFTKKAPPPKTVKMLTQDGKLVEVEIQKITGTKTKISNKDIHNWIAKK
jgi:hypothetical protein